MRSAVIPFRGRSAAKVAPTLDFALVRQLVARPALSLRANGGNAGAAGDLARELAEHCEAAHRALVLAACHGGGPMVQHYLVRTLGQGPAQETRIAAFSARDACDRLGICPDRHVWVKPDGPAGDPDDCPDLSRVLEDLEAEIEIHAGTPGSTFLARHRALWIDPDGIACP